MVMIAFRLILIDHSTEKSTINVILDLAFGGVKQRIKHRQKQNMIEKVTAIVAPLVLNLTSSQTILVVDLSKIACSYFVVDALDRVKGLNIYVLIIGNVF